MLMRYFQGLFYPSQSYSVLSTGQYLFVDQQASGHFWYRQRLRSVRRLQQCCGRFDALQEKPKPTLVQISDQINEVPTTTTSYCILHTVSTGVWLGSKLKFSQRPSVWTGKFVLIYLYEWDLDHRCAGHVLWTNKNLNVRGVLRLSCRYHVAWF